MNYDGPIPRPGGGCGVALCRALLVLGLAVTAGAQGVPTGAQKYNLEPMILPHVEHIPHRKVEVTDEVVRTCPDGYEGHFVDLQPGFTWERYQGWAGTNIWSLHGDSYAYLPQTTLEGTAAGYTICFRKDFMDKVRSNPDLITARPSPPRGL